MEPNESGLSSYYHHHPQPQPQPPPPTVSPPPTNGILSNPPHMVYPHSVPPPLVSSETVRRKRGRPRKYGTPEQAAAAKRMASAASTSVKKDASFTGGAAASSFSTKKSQGAPGNAAQSFIPHIITVASGEDVGQKIMLFMQQSKREICILSASGSISNASLCQPATSGGSITYEGRFDIISLCGSYIRSELGGRSGGLSVCLSSTDGQIIGGGVGGPLTAAGPIQVIVGAFLIDNKKDIVADVEADTSGNKYPSPVGGMPVSNAGFPMTVDPSENQFMIQPRSMQMSSPHANDWSGTDSRSNASYDFSGRMGSVAHHSPENGDYDHLAGRD